MNLFRSVLLAAALLASAAASSQAADPTPTPTPAPPTPNSTSLHPLAGKYAAGRSKVTIETAPTYNGGSHLDARSLSDTALKIRLVGWVLTPSGRVAIDNQLAFHTSGVMTGRNLAPGIARSAPFSGTFTAAGRKITFSGVFTFGDAAGTFSGFVHRNGNGRLFVVYSVFLTGRTQALYTYNYSATKPRP
jgi:hypothetical protein